MFIYEQITNALPVSQAEHWSDVIGGSIESFCDKQVGVYKDAYLKSLLALDKEIGAHLAPPGTGKIESSSAFVQFTSNAFSSHNRGHWDLTREAVGEAPDLAFSKDALALISSASQAPDLFKWSDERFHAHTDEYRNADAADRAAKLESGKERFRKLLASLLERVRQKSATGLDDAEALFLLGAAAHLVQDLVYHRGMTLRQHAGLAYYAKRNPDYPEGTLAKERWREAVALSRRVVFRTGELVGAPAWRRMQGWTVQPSVNIRALGERVFGREDIGVPALIDYYLMMVPYATGSRDRDELTDHGCNADKGLACWEPETLVNEALQ